jgi:hypothetical protein
MGWLVCGKRERKCHANAVGPTGLTTGATGGIWISPPLDCFYKVVGFGCGFGLAMSAACAMLFARSAGFCHLKTGGD